MRKAGGLFIADEVQPGFGRTGDAMWGFQRHGDRARHRHARQTDGQWPPRRRRHHASRPGAAFSPEGDFFNTFGGNPVSMAAALAVLEVIEDERIIENAAGVGAYLASAGLRTSPAHAAKSAKSDAAGLSIGVEIVRTGLRREPDNEGDQRARRTACAATRPDQHHRPSRRTPQGPAAAGFSKDNADLFLTAMDDVLADIVGR